MVMKKLKGEITDLTAKMEYNSKAGFSEIRKKHECSENQINKINSAVEEDRAHLKMFYAPLS